MLDSPEGIKRQTGGIGRPLLVVLAVVVVVIVWLAADEDAGSNIKKQAELKTLEVIGDAAANRPPGTDHFHQ